MSVSTAWKSSSVTRRSSLGTIPSLIFSMGISGGGGETGGIENGKLRIENFLLGREEFLQGSQQGYYTQDPAGIDGDTGDGASHGTSIGVTGVGE